MKTKTLASIVFAAAALPALASDVTYRNDVQPFIKGKCAECHGADAPSLQEFKLDEEKYKKAKLGPRTDSYEHLLAIVVYPDPGAFMRRLDDGTNTPDKKPGNMYKYLGETDAERAKALVMLKAWVGDGGWNLNRWAARGDVPALTKEQMNALKLKY